MYLKNLGDFVSRQGLSTGTPLDPPLLWLDWTIILSLLSIKLHNVWSMCFLAGSLCWIPWCSHVLGGERWYRLCETQHRGREQRWALEPIAQKKDKMQNFAAKTAMQRLTTETEKMQCCRKLLLAYRDILNHGTTCSKYVMLHKR